MEISNIKSQISKIHIKNAKIFAFLLCVFGFLFLIFTFLSGCANLKEYPQSENRLLAIPEGTLKGMGKVDVIKRFGHPLATSKSDISESWYYAKPKAIWIWFKEDKVDHWEVE